MYKTSTNNQSLYQTKFRPADWKPHDFTEVRKANPFNRHRDLTRGYQ